MRKRSGMQGILLLQRETDKSKNVFRSNTSHVELGTLEITSQNKSPSLRRVEENVGVDLY